MQVLFTFLHIAAALLAFGTLVIPGIILSRTAKSGDVARIRSVFGSVLPVAKTGAIIINAAGILGVVTAIADGFPLLSGWLVAAYALFIAGMLTGKLYLGPHYGTIYGMAMASPLEAPSPQLLAAIGRRSYPWMHAANWAVWILLLWVMVAKPQIG